MFLRGGAFILLSLITKTHDPEPLTLRRKTVVFFSVLTTIKLSDEQCSAKPVRDSTSEESGKYKAGTLAEHGSRLRMLHGDPAHTHSPFSGPGMMRERKEGLRFTDCLGLL